MSYIDKDEAIFELERQGYDGADLIRSMSPEDVRENDHGEWKEITWSFGEGWYSCSLCGSAVQIGTQKMFKFCPWCGSAMDESGE